MIKCKCGNMVSKQAKICPGCGHPTKQLANTKGCLGCLAVLLVFFAIGWLLVFTKKESAQKIQITEKASSFKPLEADRSEEAKETVWKCKIPGTTGDVLQLSAGYFELEKQKGNFMEIGSSYGLKEGEDIYRVYFNYKSNSSDQKAEWQVDFKTKTIRPKNQQAFILSGNNEVLSF